MEQRVTSYLHYPLPALETEIQRLRSLHEANRKDYRDRYACLSDRERTEHPKHETFDNLVDALCARQLKLEALIQQSID